MKGEYIFCECGSRMFRVRAQSMKGDIPVGYYCPGCQALQDIKRQYLVPVDLVTRMDSFFKTVSKREAYLAILKTGDRAIPTTITDQKIDVARSAIGASVDPFCRPAGKHEPVRLDRVKLCQDLQRIE